QSPKSVSYAYGFDRDVECVDNLVESYSNHKSNDRKAAEEIQDEIQIRGLHQAADGFKVPDDHHDKSKKDGKSTETPSPEIPESETPVFDRLAMLKRFGDDEETVSLIIDAFIEEANGIVMSLEQAVNTGDEEEIKALSHALKGSSANVHAMLLNIRAIEMEMTVKRGIMNRTPSLLEEIKKELKLFTDLLTIGHV
ncbi:MAG: Hpt domain-containing protein, partial [Desulfamplus sp.]|nr:Hpt domain-containing protein [Desulfamplus sp.]